MSDSFRQVPGVRRELLNEGPVVIERTRLFLEPHTSSRYGVAEMRRIRRNPVWPKKSASC